MSVARQLAHRIIEKGQLDDHGQRCQGHNVFPSGKVIAVQVQKLQTHETSEYLASGKRFELVA